jgi:hypothetical protein
MTDKEFVTIQEFTKFAKDVLKNKGSENMYRYVGKTKDHGPDQIKTIKAQFSTYFSKISEWENFKGTIDYKTGFISMYDLERKCQKDEDDKSAFKAYIENFKALYFDVRKNLIEFITKLGLEEGSNEAAFMTSVFTEIGGDLLETIKSGGDTKDIATLLPKVFEMLKNGTLMRCFERLKDGSVKISKILRAITKLVEDWENENQPAAIEEASTTTETTLMIE